MPVKKNARKKKIAKKSRRSRNIVVNVNIPKGSQKRYGPDVAGFLFANPVAGIVIVTVGIALFMIVGGLSLPVIIGMFMNPWMWVLAIVITLAAKPKSNTTIAFAVLMGLLFWGYDIYMEYLAIQQICSIPIVGMFMCGAWNVISFIPKLFGLGLKIIVSFAMIWIGEFIRYQLTK
jgi:hypothetical protein